MTKTDVALHCAIKMELIYIQTGLKDQSGSELALEIRKKD